MGANYDFIVTTADESDSYLECISSFLISRGFLVDLVGDLQSMEISDAAAILIGPRRNRMVQLVANASALTISLQEWFDENPLAKYLSLRMVFAIHLWCLDSGFVVGYSAYRNGKKIEADCLFSPRANITSQIIDGIKTPAVIIGHTLADALGESSYTFPTNLQEFRNREVGFGTLISRLGFSEHLVDFYDAVDDKVGVVIEGSKHKSIALSEWRALQFRKA
jgi:hypothetical protein